MHVLLCFQGVVRVTVRIYPAQPTSGASYRVVSLHLPGETTGQVLTRRAEPIPCAGDITGN